MLRGIILLLGAIVKIQSAFNMKKLRLKKWYLILICALAVGALGAVLLWNPFQEEKYMILYIGICLILDGLTNLISLICIQTRLRKLKKIQKANPDIDLKELLEQQARAEAEKNAVIVPGHTEDTGKEQE